MRKIISLIILALATLTAGAQNVHFRFGGGLSSHFGSSAQAVGAFKVGVGYEVEFDQHWSFTPGFEIYGKGWKDPNQTVYAYDPVTHEPVFDSEGNHVTTTMSRSATQNYLQLPLVFNYYVRTGESRYVVLGAGPYVAYGISGKQKTRGDSGQTGSDMFYYEKKTFKEPGTHRFDAGIRAMAGYQFSSGVIVGLEADFGLTKFNRSGDRNVSGLVCVGYKL